MVNYYPTLGDEAVNNMREQEEYQKLWKELNLAMDKSSKHGAGRLRFDYFKTGDNHNLLSHDSLKLMKEEYRNQNVEFQYRVIMDVGYQIMLTWFKHV